MFKQRLKSVLPGVAGQHPVARGSGQFAAFGRVGQIVTRQIGDFFRIVITGHFIGGRQSVSTKAPAAGTSKTRWLTAPFICLLVQLKLMAECS